MQDTLPTVNSNAAPFLRFPSGAHVSCTSDDVAPHVVVETINAPDHAVPNDPHAPDGSPNDPHAWDGATMFHMR